MVFIIFLQIVLIFLNAVFACAEIAVLQINETKLEKMANDGSRRAKRLFKLTREPAKFLATIQVAITLSGFLGSAFAADNFSEPLVEWLLSFGVKMPRATLDAIAVVVITLILSYFTLVFGELVPKRLAMKKSESIAMGISGLIGGISVLFRPIVWFLSVSTNAVLKLIGIDPNETEEEVSEEEIRMMVDAGSEKGTIDDQEKEFIQNVFDFNDITAKDIITHRIDVVGLWLEESDEEWANTIHSSRHTLYPVCGETADDIVGVLNAKDYFRLDDKSRENVLTQAVTPAYFVPETIKADVLFKNMKAERTSMAIVVDEYGGMEGIVTFSDLIEEIVGKFEDEPEEDLNEPTAEKLDDEKWLVKGNIVLLDLEKITGADLVSDDYDTITGVVFSTLGAIPEDGESEIEIETDTMHILIKKVLDHQVEEAVITIKTPESIEE